MPTYQVSGTGGVGRDRRPRRVRNPKTGAWLLSPVTAGEKPSWTKDRAAAWLGLPLAASRQVEVLRDAHGVEAELD
jgi:hypothetical protein